jgi:hypothetical protein
MQQRLASACNRSSPLPIVLAAVLLAVFSLWHAEGIARAEEPYTVQLKTGTLHPADGDYAAGIAYLAEHGAAGSAHVLVQMREIPDAAARATLAARGIELQGYLPDHAWYGRVASTLDAPALSAAGVRWIAPLRLEHKLSARVLAAEYSSWSDYDGGRRIFVVQLHNDVSEERGREILGDHGAVIGGYILSINTFVAALDPDAPAELALVDDVRWVDERPPALTEVNDGIRAAIGVNTVQQAPYNLNGQGTNVLVYDVGLVGSHPDFGSRVTAGEGGGVANHSTHVAGTVGGDGTNSGGNYKGMAPSCRITSYLYESCSPNCLYDSPQDIEENYGEGLYTFGADLATNSLGANIASNGYPCNWEGDYETTAQLLDAICHGSLGVPFLSLWAAGNERHSGRCGTTYNTTGVPATAKNTIVVGATMSNDHSMSWFSSWGPVDDGRIRPDVCAPGCQSGGDGGITSTLPGGGYGAMCGTSMATPATAGVAALMLQQLRRMPGDPGGMLHTWPSTMKALLVNTAYDYGNIGPDFQFGYGEIRPQAGADAILNRYAILQRRIEQGGHTTFDFMVEAGSPLLQATVAWSDPPGQHLAQIELVNDLDIYFEAPSGTIHRPWILDPANPSAAATRGLDRRNPMEQVPVLNPQEGHWILHVVGYAVPDGPQDYSVVANLPLDVGSASVDTGAGITPAPWLQTGPSHPNPSRGTTAIEYTVSRPAALQLRIRDVTGRVVRTIEARPATAGVHQASWDGRDQGGRTLPAGIYFYRAEDAAGREASGPSRSLLLLR